ncbi:MULTISPECIES: ABC transporter permease [Eisenbergiella]|uniref:ABC transporter permease n=1 Tax=Eisenbergiella porci TaxID=2652274 RepID=A0A6N7WQ62_9FIRM|nr:MULTISPECIES: ABC transporter permease [Eisenbergiella]MDY2652852.1 ABC transporter permease [Eisenbergiella porci]MSS91945.1 ABC transporter permease [Eisenbergiella porci]
MKVLLQYTFRNLKNNKKTTVASMTAVLIASTLLFSLCSVLYNNMAWQADIERYESGGWHAEAGGQLTKEDLEIIENNLQIDKVMVKGPFMSVQLPEESRFPYLLLRDADENYWSLMGEKNGITEGRIPEKPGEIVVSKSFFDNNPGFRLGDSFTLTAGHRMAGGELWDAGAGMEGEQFLPEKEVTLTVVGKLDTTTPTTTPGYYAMGFLKREALNDADELVVYVTMKDIRDTYKVMPPLMEQLGLEKNEYGNYENHFRYHARLLALNGVFPPVENFSLEYLSNYTNLFFYATLVLLAAAAFVLIIHSAFAMSARTRIRQLGMFRSVGATPGQIRASVLLEGIGVSLVPIAAGIGLGQLFTALMVRIYTGILGDLIYFPFTLRFSWGIALIAVLVSFLTVLVSASLPAEKMAKLSPVDAIRMQEDAGRLKTRRLRRRQNRRSCLGLFGVEGVMAAASRKANRRAFRAGLAALTMCFVLVSGFFCMLTLNNLVTERNAAARHYNILMRWQMTSEPEPEMLEEVFSLPGLVEGTWFYRTRVSYWAKPSRETEEFAANGGFAEVNPDHFSILERDGSYRIRADIVGLEDSFFDDYCRALGSNPKGYYNTEVPRAVLVSNVSRYPGIANNSEKQQEEYRMLSLEAGDVLTLEEKLRDSDETDYSFQVEIGDRADKRPVLDEYNSDYSIQLYVPIETYREIVAGFRPETAENYYQICGVGLTSVEKDIEVTEKIREISSRYLAEEDFTIRSREEERQENQVSGRAMEAVVNLIGALLSLIGIFNALSAAGVSLQQRRREFAVLRSAGMDEGQLKKMLLLEGLRTAVSPVLTGLPVLFVILIYLLGVTGLSWESCLPVLPYGKILQNAGLVIASVGAAYLLAYLSMRKETIADAVRDETV